jgi:transposase
LDKNGYYKNKDTIVINADNGPENSSRRTQFMKRMIEFSAWYNVKIILAYYPPYHSKYNPIERTWGVLEQHWNGSILNSVDTVLGYAKSMTWKGKNPIIKYSKKVYQTGKKLTNEMMNKYEAVMDRKSNLEKWFVTLNPEKCKKMLKA